MLTAAEARRHRKRGLILLTLPPIGMLALLTATHVVNGQIARNNDLPNQGAMALLGLILIICGLVAFVAMLMGLIVFIRSFR